MNPARYKNTLKTGRSMKYITHGIGLLGLCVALSATDLFITAIGVAMAYCLVGAK